MKGIYVLVIEISQELKAKIGSLGEIAFEKGIYAYVGSAQNNLEKRIERHLSVNKKRHWHIDYLLESGFAEIKSVYYREASKEEECVIAGKLGAVETSVTGFGSSDCRCKSHLLRLKGLDEIQSFGMSEYNI